MISSYFSNNAQPFEMQLAMAFENVWDFIPDDTNTEWTKAVKTIMHDELKKMQPDLKAACCSIKADEREWLYDFVGYEYNETGLRNVILIAESEWRSPLTEDYRYDVQYDFEKLILAKAPYKLMIFEGQDEDEVKDHISHLVKIVQQFKLTNSGDRYMFAGWITSKEFHYDLYIHP
jgi:hypothetical protein